MEDDNVAEMCYEAGVYGYRTLNGIGRFVQEDDQEGSECSDLFI